MALDGGKGLYGDLGMWEGGGADGVWQGEVCEPSQVQRCLQLKLQA